MGLWVCAFVRLCVCGLWVCGLCGVRIGAGGEEKSRGGVFLRECADFGRLSLEIGSFYV